jgi:hypothetical protein
MLQSGTSVVLWIFDEAARLFLGLHCPKDEVCRWAIIGTVDREQAGVGVWLDITRLEERQGNDVTKVWTVQPSVCLIRWNYIITAQLLENVTSTRIPGFQASTE